MTRPHGDIDVVLLERDEHALCTDLPGVDLLLMTGPGDREQPWPDAETSEHPWTARLIGTGEQQ